MKIIILKRWIIILILFIIYGCKENLNTIDKIFPSNEIIFVRYKLGFPNHEIWAMDGDGKNQVRILEKPKPIYSISWSPDRKKIAFQYTKKNICELRIVEIGRGEKILYKGDIRSVFFSPKGDKIAFVSEDPNQIYIIDYKGEKLKRLTNHLESSCVPCWSPDGNKIVFNRWVSGEGWKIYIMNADGTEERKLRDSPSFIEEKYPCWSPDGKWIAFEETNQNKKLWERKRIILIDPITKEERVFSPLPKPLFGISSMCFSPDSKKLVFEVTDLENKHNDIFTIDIDGRNLKNLTNTPDWDESCPSWRPMAKR